MQKISSKKELLSEIEKKDRAFLLLYKSGSEKSECAFQTVGKVSHAIEDVSIYTADVKDVRDIHPSLNVTSVPTLIEFENKEMKGIVKGCHGEAYYKTIFEKNAFKAETTDGVAQKNVIIYSTPTCTHCTNLKNYLNKNNIRYRDIDVSKDQKAAEQMVKKSGQQGVPQTDINGQIIVGFDKIKIDRLLNIQAQ